jgi:hypothetical protein
MGLNCQGSRVRLDAGFLQLGHRILSEQEWLIRPHLYQLLLFSRISSRIYDLYDQLIRSNPSHRPFVPYLIGKRSMLYK